MGDKTWPLDNHLTKLSQCVILCTLQAASANTDLMFAGVHEQNHQQESFELWPGSLKTSL